MTATVLPQDLIRRKRDGGALSPAEIAFLARGMADQTLSEGQLAAFAMAVYFRGLTPDERIALTQALTRSGTVLDWTDAGLAGPVLDKHSTGGVGDKISLILAPLVAACGGYVPMVAGRGLGHTGGTVDKLASIPGYDTAPDLPRFRQVVQTVGCAIIGQTAELAPADRRFYAVRDVTATVEALDLIVASILSKKLAEGLHGLVLDVKTGSGAFMTTLDQARTLAQSLVEVARGAGLPATALITDMDQALGRTAGNALEVREAIAYLRGSHRDPRLHALVLALGSEMLLLGGLASDTASARRQLQTALDDGRAAERCAAMVRALGGPAELLDHPERFLPPAPVIAAALPRRSGYVLRMETRSLGLTIVALGGGRRRTGDPIDYAVGLSELCPVGEWVDTQRSLALVHARRKDQARAAIAALQAAIAVGNEAPPPRPLIHERWGGPD
jgi:thymidine phosphorylase